MSLQSFFVQESCDAPKGRRLVVAWMTLAVLMVGVVASVVPAFANNCVPYQDCYGIFCDSCDWVGSCEPYGGCAPHFMRDLWCNSPTYGCYDAGYGCTSDCP